MDPEFITTDDWQGISVMLRFLWAYWFIIIGFGSTLLLAHAIIPSLVSTRQLPLVFERFRPLLYMGALGILGLALALLVLASVNAYVIGDFWKRWWI